MNTYKVSLIFTVKNEEKSIKSLLDSILNQTKMPDEIIIVDGGSTDKTIEIIEKYYDLLPINLIIKNGVNIAKGRNIAIKNAKYPIIAVTDAGCKLDNYWFEGIIKPFHDDTVDIVSGKYIGTGGSIFQKVISYLLITDFNKVNENSFNPSSRSIAFRKSAWKDISGYPEWLDYAEDTYFDKKLRENGKKFYLNKKAIVYWEMRKTFRKLYRQYFNYAKYEAIALNYPFFYIFRLIIWISIFSVFILSIIFRLYFIISLGIIFLLGLITLRVILKLKNKKLNLKAYLYGLIIYIIFELALFIGFINGLFKRFKIKKKIY